MIAWANLVPLPKPDARLLDLLNAALSDDDLQVKRYAGTLLLKVGSNALNVNIAGNTALYDTLVGLLDDNDPALRQQVVTALDLYVHPKSQALENVFLERINLERDTTVKGRVVNSLSDFARQGSERSRAEIAAATKDSSIQVRIGALIALGRLRDSTLLPLVLSNLSAPEALVRRVAIGALAGYGIDTVRANANLLKERLSQEQDEQVRSQLQELISQSESPPQRQQ